MQRKVKFLIPLLLLSLLSLLALWILPRGDRAKIALHLLDSLQQEQSEFSPEAIEKAWIDESSSRQLEQRCAWMAVS